MPIADNQAWRKSLVHPIAVPNLSHTDTLSKFSYKPAPILRPDGSISKDLKELINKEVRNLPLKTTSFDVLDMQRRDKSKRRLKAITLKNKVKRVAASRQSTRGRNSPTKDVLSLEDGNDNGEEDSGYYSDEYSPSEAADFSTPNLSSTQLSAMSVVLGRRPVSPERMKKPFSNSSLFNALLESQIGGEPDRWDLTCLQNSNR